MSQDIFTTVSDEMETGLRHTHYHKTKQHEGDVAVRSLVRRELRRHRGNVSAVARAVGCSRLTVRRARDGTLEDGDRTPHEQPRTTASKVVSAIVGEQKLTGYGRRRLARHLLERLGLEVSEHTLRNVLKRAAGGD